MLELIRARDGQESQPVSGQLIRLAATLIREGKYGEAEQLARECLAIREKLFPAGNFQISAARRTVGQALAGQKRYSEAEPLLLTAYDEMKRLEASAGLNANQRAQLATTAEALAQLYEATNQPEKAAEWKQKAAASAATPPAPAAAPATPNP